MNKKNFRRGNIMLKNSRLIGLSILIGSIALLIFSSICFRRAEQTLAEDVARYIEENQKAFPIGLYSSQSCTIIYASDGNIALAGNNEDWNRPIGNIWFLPAEKGKFGRVYFGWRFNDVRYPQGGMNDKGLFFDGATAENVVVPRDSSKIPYEGNLILKAMEECSTVEEALKLYDRYDV